MVSTNGVSFVFHKRGFIFSNRCAMKAGLCAMKACLWTRGGRGIRETLAVANAGEWLVRLVAGLGVRPGGQRGMIKQVLIGMESEQCGTAWWGGLG